MRRRTERPLREILLSSMFHSLKLVENRTGRERRAAQSSLSLLSSGAELQSHCVVVMPCLLQVTRFLVETQRPPVWHRSDFPPPHVPTLPE